MTCGGSPGLWHFVTSSSSPAGGATSGWSWLTTGWLCLEPRNGTHRDGSHRGRGGRGAAAGSVAGDVNLDRDGAGVTRDGDPRFVLHAGCGGAGREASRQEEEGKDDGRDLRHVSSPTAD